MRQKKIRIALAQMANGGNIKNNIMSVPNVYLSENGQAYDASILIDKAGTMQEKVVPIHNCENLKCICDHRI